MDAIDYYNKYAAKIFEETVEEEVEEEFYKLAESLVQKCRHNACTFLSGTFQPYHVHQLCQPVQQISLQIISRLKI